MRSSLFAPQNQEQESAQPGLRLQNSKGDVRFEAMGAGGIGR